MCKVPIIFPSCAPLYSKTLEIMLHRSKGVNQKKNLWTKGSNLYWKRDVKRTPKDDGQIRAECQAERAPRSEQVKNLQETLSDI